ncbi:hypothetical protein ACA910_018678 [Epithemia clementina (nom. ined.)]
MKRSFDSHGGGDLVGYFTRPAGWRNILPNGNHNGHSGSASHPPAPSCATAEAATIESTSSYTGIPSNTTTRTSAAETEFLAAATIPMMENKDTNNSNRNSANHHPEDMNDLSQLPELRNRVRSYVHNAILCLPVDESRAYRAAMAFDAELVQTETDPIRFVRYCQYDVLAGARRLCAYWTERLDLFGPERAFLPLTLTGTGALTPQDLVSLRAGYPTLLPNNTKTGQSCMMFDRRCRVPNMPRESVLRCLFYLWKVLAENDASQVEGIVALVVAATPRTKMTDMDWEFAHRGISMVTRIFPVKNQVHFLATPQQKTPVMASQLVDGIAWIVRQAFASNQSYNNPWTDICVHIQTPEDASNKLELELRALGFTSHSIPNFYGGEWTLSHFLDWCQERMEREQEIYQSRLLPRGYKNKNDLTSTTTTTTISNAEVMDVQWNRTPRNATANPAVTTATSARAKQDQGKKKPPEVDLGSGGDALDKQQQRRMEDVIRSRRKRERQRLEFQQLQLDSSRLVRENELLKQEQTLLARLWTEAEQCVAQLLLFQNNSNVALDDIKDYE